MQSSRFFWQNPRREIYNLGMVSGPVLLEIKGKSRIFMKNERRNVVFSPSRSNLGLVSSRLGHPVANREIDNLTTVSEPVLFKTKGKIVKQRETTFIFSGVKKRE